MDQYREQSPANPSRTHFTQAQLQSLAAITGHQPPSIRDPAPETRNSIKRHYTTMITQASTPKTKKEAELKAATAYLILWLTAVNATGNIVTQENYLDALHAVVQGGTTLHLDKLQLAMQHYHAAYIYSQAIKTIDYLYSPIMGAVFHCQFNGLFSQDPKLTDDNTLVALHQAAECYLAFTKTPLAKSGMPLLFEPLLTSATTNNATSKLHIVRYYLAYHDDKLKFDAELQYTLKSHCLFIANHAIETRQIEQLLHCIEQLKGLMPIDDDYHTKLIFLSEKRRYELQDVHKTKHLLRLFELGYHYIKSAGDDFAFLVDVYQAIHTHEALTHEQRNTIRYYYSLLCLNQKHDVSNAKLALAEIYLGVSYTEEEEDKEDDITIAAQYCQQLLSSLETPDDYQRLVLCLETLQRDEPSADYADNIFTCHLKIYQLGTATVASLATLFCAAYHAYLTNPITDVDAFSLEPEVAFAELIQLGNRRSAHIHQRHTWEQLQQAYNKFTSLPAQDEHVIALQKIHYVFALLCLLRNNDQFSDKYLAQAHACLRIASKQPEPLLLCLIAATILADTQHTHATALFSLFKDAIALVYFSGPLQTVTAQKAETDQLLTQITTIKAALTAPKAIPAPLLSLSSSGPTRGQVRKSQIPLPTAGRLTSARSAAELERSDTPTQFSPSFSSSTSSKQHISFWQPLKTTTPLARVAAPPLSARTSPDSSSKKDLYLSPASSRTGLLREKPKEPVDKAMPTAWTPRTWTSVHHRKPTTASHTRSNVQSKAPSFPTKGPPA